MMARKPDYFEQIVDKLYAECGYDGAIPYPWVKKFLRGYHAKVRRMVRDTQEYKLQFNAVGFVVKKDILKQLDRLKKGQP